MRANGQVTVWKAVQQCKDVMCVPQSTSERGITHAGVGMYYLVCNWLFLVV